MCVTTKNIIIFDRLKLVCTHYCPKCRRVRGAFEVDKVTRRSER